MEENYKNVTKRRLNRRASGQENNYQRKGFNPKSKNNLQPFSSTNQPARNGRPSGAVSIGNRIRAALETVDSKTKQQVVDDLVSAAINHAIAGKFPYFKEILLRVDGKAQDKPLSSGTPEWRVVYVNEPTAEERERARKNDLTKEDGTTA